MSAGIKAIVGLGNPGSSYANTRHNAGAWFTEALAAQAGVSFKVNTRFKGRHAVMQSADETGKCTELHLLIPTTFMNLSGQSVGALARYYAISPQQILVAHDDIDLQTGDIRLKFDGGHGGHNGLKDIIACLGTTGFHRLRIGVSHPGHRDDVTDYVLGTPSKTERGLIDAALQKADTVMPALVSGQFQQAAMRLHTKEN